MVARCGISDKAQVVMESMQQAQVVTRCRNASSVSRPQLPRRDRARRSRDLAPHYSTLMLLRVGRSLPLR